MEFPHTPSASDLLGGLKDKFGFSNRTQPVDDDYYEPYDEFGYEDEGDFGPADDYGPYGYDPVEDERFVEGVSRSNVTRFPRLVTPEEARASASSLGVAAAAERAQAGHVRGDMSQPKASGGFEPRSYERPMSDFADFTSPYQERERASQPARTREAAPAKDVFEHDAPAARHTDMTSAGLNSLFEPTTSAVRGVSSRRALNVISPKAYQDVQGIARTVKAGDVAVLCLRLTDDALAKRVLDFSFGVAAALDARVDCVDNQVFAVSTGMALSIDERETLRNQGIL